MIIFPLKLVYNVNTLVLNALHLLNVQFADLLQIEILFQVVPV